MPKECLRFDKTEIAAEYFIGNKHEIADLKGEDIASVAIEPCKVGLFKNKQGERIVITTAIPAAPIFYYRHKNKKVFDQYVEGLELFCKNNGVKFSKTSPG